jgi:hypothetical protein
LVDELRFPRTPPTRIKQRWFADSLSFSPWLRGGYICRLGFLASHLTDENAVS